MRALRGTLPLLLGLTLALAPRFALAWDQPVATPVQDDGLPDGDMDLPEGDFGEPEPEPEPTKEPEPAKDPEPVKDPEPEPRRPVTEPDALAPPPDERSPEPQPDTASPPDEPDLVSPWTDEDLDRESGRRPVGDDDMHEIEVGGGRVSEIEDEESDLLANPWFWGGVAGGSALLIGGGVGAGVLIYSMVNADKGTISIVLE